MLQYRASRWVMQHISITIGAKHWTEQQWASTCCGVMEECEKKSHWVVRPVVVSSVDLKIHCSRAVPPIVTLTYFCGVLTVISSTHPRKQRVESKIRHHWNPRAIQTYTCRCSCKHRITWGRRKGLRYSPITLISTNERSVGHIFTQCWSTLTELNFLHPPTPTGFYRACW